MSAPTPPRPSAITWYRVFAIASAILYGFLAVIGAIVTGGIGGRPDAELAVMAALCALPVLAFYAVALMVPYKPWGWTFALVALALGLPTILAPGAIALMIAWQRADVKSAFGRA
jgi:hypothetical protein